MRHHTWKGIVAIVTSGTLCALVGCAHDTWSYTAVPDVQVSRADNLANQGPLVLKSASDEARSKGATTQPISPQTILMASWKHDRGTYQSSVEQTLVVTLDGPVQDRQYWLTPDNTVLITSSAYSAPIRERVHLAGSIKITRVNADSIVADVAVRETADVDSSGFIAKPYDPAYRQWPFRLTGQRTFIIARPGDASLDPSVAKWARE